MTTEEIKNSLPMSELMNRYGISINHNMCSCPFHGKDKHPSMRVYSSSAHCFACGWNGDQIRFVQDMDHVDFKTAFYSLGGSYEHQENEKARIKAQWKLKESKNRREREGKADREFFNTLTESIDICRYAKEIYEPFSDEYCIASNKLPYLEYIYEEKYLRSKEINEISVYRECRKIRQRFLP